MAKKKAPAPTPPPGPRKAIQAARTRDESEGIAVGRALTCPANAAARAMLGLEHPDGLGRQIDLPDLADVLRDRAKAVQAGDMTQVEAMLVNQATVLQSLFTRLVERGMGCQTADGFEVNLRIALRAQAQSVRAIEALVVAKNPPVRILQNNIAHGPQQVNNGRVHPSTETAPTELLEEVTHGMDTGTPRAASRGYPALEAMGEIDRTPHRCRKGRVIPEP